MNRYSILRLVIVIVAALAAGSIFAQSTPDQSTSALPKAAVGDLIPPNDPRIAEMGRIDTTTPTRICVGYPDAHIFLTDGSLVNDDDPARPQKSVLNSYLQEIATRLTDPRVHVFTSRHYPGDPTDGHPTAEQHAAMARDLEPVIRAAVGW